jgi:predicted dehydrogenase
MDSPKLNIAVIGLGFMGATHLKAWRDVPSARLHAVVDADPRRLTGDLSSVGGNLGGPGERFDFSNVRTCQSLDEALADRAVDAVDICLPTDQHAVTAMAAFRAGKHVLTEKPIALDVATAEALCREAEVSSRILMAAHVLRFFPAYVKLADSVRERAPVRYAFFRRRAAAPVWSPWLRNPARSGGAILDMLIHDADYCISLWGMPESVRARGHFDPERGTDIIHAELFYPGLGPVVIDGGWYGPKSYPFSMEFAVITDEGTLEWSSGANDFREHTAEGESRSVELGDADPFVAELAYFTDCAANGVQPDRCPPAQSAMAVSLIARLLESREKNGERIQC